MSVKKKKSAEPRIIHVSCQWQNLLYINLTTYENKLKHFVNVLKNKSLKHNRWCPFS